MPVLSNSQKFDLVTIMNAHIPHAALLGIQVESIEREELTLRLPYQTHLIGNHETGTLHGGVLTVLLDQTLGMATVCSDASEPSVTPTLDLRIDHLGIAPAGMSIFASARVYKATRKILFVEGIAYCESKEKPIARATGSWVRVAEVDLSWIVSSDKDAASP
ncbi:MAG: PaaI family thioesterase [Halioglobus sp.]|nr:PaaI family thioesterase [Halioglobus sp.]